jgi:hypothetical protein
MAAITQTVSPMIADDIAAKAAGASTPPPPTSNPLKLKKAAAGLFEAEDVSPTDISFLQVAIGKLLSLAVKERKMPTGETETYTGKDGSEKTRKVTKASKIVQVTLDYDEFFACVTDAPTDYRVTNACLPVGGITSRVVTKKATKKVVKKAVATPAKAASAAGTDAPKKAKKASSPKAKAASAAGTDAPKKAKKASSPKAKAAAPKVLAMPVLTDEQLETLLSYRDPETSKPIAPKAHVKTLEDHLKAMGVEEKDFKQARADWVAYRADHAPPAEATLLDDAKLEHLRALNIGPAPQSRNPTLVGALDNWGIAEADRKRAAGEYKAWAKEKGIVSAKGSKTASPKAAAAPAPSTAPPAIRAPEAEAEEDGSESDEEDEEIATPRNEAEELHDTALEAIGDAEDIAAFE